MRDLFAEILSTHNSGLPPFDVALPPGADPEEEAKKIVAKGGPRDLFAEIAAMGPSVAASPEAEKPGFWENALSSIGAGVQVDAAGQARAAAGVGEAVLALGSGAASSLTAPVNEYIQLAGGKSKREAAAEAARLAESTTYQPRTEEGKEYTEVAGKVLGFPFEVAGDFGKTARQMVVESPLAAGVKAVGGEPELIGQPVEAAITFGAGAKAFGLPSKIARTVAESNWYRGLTIPERGLVNLSLKDMVGKGLTEGEVLRRWNSPQWREEALSVRRTGEGQVAPEAPVRSSSAARPVEPPNPENVLTADSRWGETFELRPTAAEKADLFKIIEGWDPNDIKALPPPTNLGEGFTMTEPPKQVLKEKAWSAGDTYEKGLEVEYVPQVTSKGTPFKTEAWAEKIAINRGIPEGEFEVIPYGDGYAYKRIPKVEVPVEDFEAPSEVEAIVEPELPSVLPEGEGVLPPAAVETTPAPPAVVGPVKALMVDGEVFTANPDESIHGQIWDRIPPEKLEDPKDIQTGIVDEQGKWVPDSPTTEVDPSVLQEGVGIKPSQPLKEMDRWLSPTAEVMKTKGQDSMPAWEWRKRVQAWGEKSPHVKDENRWNGIEEWLESRAGEKVTKDEVVQWLNMSKEGWAKWEQVAGKEPIPKEEWPEGATDAFIHNPPDQWASHNIPGGIPGTEKVYILSTTSKDPIETFGPQRKAIQEEKDSGKISQQQYREKLDELDRVVSESIGVQYASPHFPGKPNVVVHVRTQERVDGSGEKGILIETAQSDWHQSKGGETTQDERISGVKNPYAPFETTWHEMALKHVLDIAAQDPSIKWVGWAGGEVQNRRWGKGDLGERNFEVYGDLFDSVGEAKRYIGDLLENGAITSKQADQLYRSLDDQMKQSGGSFLEVLYDKRLPKFAKKYAEKMGGRYQTETIKTPNPYQEALDDLYKEYSRGEINKGEYKDLVRELQDSESPIQNIEEASIHRIDFPQKMRDKINYEGQVFYSGFDPIAAYQSLRKSANDIKAALPIIDEMGKYYYDAGAQTFSRWQSVMKEQLKDLWEKFKQYLQGVWERIQKGEIGILRNDKGSVGFDINGEPIAKQRVIRRSEKSKLEKEAEVLQKVSSRVDKELAELTGIGGKKKFEELKNERIQKFLDDAAKLGTDAAVYRREGYQRAIEHLKKKEYESHVSKLRHSRIKLGEMISRRLKKASETMDQKDIMAPMILKKEVDLLKNLGDIEGKPLGGWTQNPIYTFEAWGREKGLDLGEKVKEMFYYPLRESSDRANKHFAKIHGKAEEIRKGLPSESSRRIYEYALSKESGGKEILEAMGVKEIPTLTPEETYAYDWMRRGYEVMYRKLNEAREASGKEPIGRVENYFTFARELSVAEKLGFGLDDTLLKNYIHPKATGFRYAHKRIGGIEKAQMDSFSLFNQYMQTATKHIHMSPHIAKMRELTGLFHEGKDTWSLKDKSPVAHTMLIDYLDHVSGQKKALLPKNVEAAMNILTKNLTFSTLSGSIRSALIQPTALNNTMTEIGPRYTARGLTDLLSKEKRGMAIEKSRHLFNAEFDLNVSQAMVGAVGKLGKAREAWNQSWLGMRPLKALDMQTRMATWLGAYAKAIEIDGMSEAKAARYADDTTVKTQGSAASFDVAPIQRTAIGKFFTTFQSFVINNFNWLAKDVVGIKNPDVKNKEILRKVMLFVAGATLINVFFEDLLGINSPLPAPISAANKEYGRSGDVGKAAVSAGLEFLQLVPGAGGVRYGSSILGAPTDFLTDVSEYIASLLGPYQGPTKPGAELLGKALGIPGTTQAAKTVKILGRGGDIGSAIVGQYPQKSNTGVKGLQGSKLKTLK